MIPLEELTSAVSDENILDSSIFSHLNLDNRLIGTHLEGNTFKKTTQYILNNINHILEKNYPLLSQTTKERISTSLEKVKIEFENLIQNEQLMNELNNSLLKEHEISLRKSLSKPPYYTLGLTEEVIDEHIAKTTSSIISKLDDPKTNSILIPGGWLGVDENPGHAMVYKIVKNEDGSYLFLVFNTGAGIEHHQAADTIDETYYPIKSFKIPKETSKKELMTYVSDLISAKVKPKFDNVIPKKNQKKYADEMDDDIYGEVDEVKEEEEENWKIKREYNETRLYRLIENIRKLKAEEIDPKTLTKAKTRGQLSGTCSMRVLMPLIHNSISGEPFLQLLYYTRLQSIIDHFRIQKNNNQLSRSDIQWTLEGGIQELSETTQKFMQRTKNGHPILTEEEGKRNLSFLETIKKELFDSRQKEKELTEKETKTHYEFTLDDSLESSYEVRFRGFSTSEVSEAKETVEISQIKEFPKRENYKTLTEFLQTAYQLIQDYDKQNLNETVLDKVEELFSAIPLEQKAFLDYCGEISTDKARETLNYIQGLTRIYGKHCNLINPHPTPKQICTAYTATLLGNKAAQSFFKQNSPFATEMEGMIPRLDFYSDIAEVTMDPFYDKRIQELKNFFKERAKDLKNKKNLFIEEFENINNGEDRASYRIEDKIDVLFFEKHIQTRLSSHQIEVLNRTQEIHSTSSFDKLRILFFSQARNLGGLISNPTFIQMAEVQMAEDYDLILQYKQLMIENSKFQVKGGVNYFKEKPDIQTKSEKIKTSLGMEVVLSDQEQRLQGLKSERSFNTQSVVFDEMPYEKPKRKTQYVFNTKLQFARVHENLSEFLNDQDLAFFRNISTMNPIPENTESNFQLLQGLNSDEFDFEYSRSFPQTFILRNECRIINNIDFFESNLETLNQKKFQNYFLYNMFTPELLNKTLESNKEFAQDLFKFIEKGLLYHSRDDEMTNGGIFLLQFSSHLLRYLNSHPNKDNFKDIIKKINDLHENSLKYQIESYKTKAKIKQSKKIKQFLGTLNDLQIINFIHIAHQKPKWVEKENLQNLFLTLIQSHQKIERRQNVYLYHELLKVHEPMKDQLKNYFFALKDEDRATLLQSLIKDLLIPETMADDKYKYSMDYPIITIQYKNDPPILFDLSRGLIQSKKIRNDFIPEEMYTKEFQNLFGDLPIPASLRNENKNLIAEFEYPLKRDDPNRKKYKAIYDSNIKQLILQAELEPGKWFQQVSPLYCLSLQGLEIPFSVYSDNISWMECENRTNSTIYYTDNKGTYKYKIHSKKDEEEDSKKKKEYYKYYKIDELNPEGSFHGYSCINPINLQKNEIYQYLSNIENPQYIEFWRKDPLKKPPKEDFQSPEFLIKLPIYGLQFESIRNEQGQLEFLWSEDKDYRLIVSSDNIMLDFPNALYLENKNTKEKIVLVPDREFHAEESRSIGLGQFDYPLKYDIHRSDLRKVSIESSLPIKIKSDQLFKFSLKANVPQGLKTIDHLKLAHLYLAKNNPDKAMKELILCGSISGTFEEVSLLMKIMRDIPHRDINDKNKMRLYHKTRNKYPNVTAVRLFAASMLQSQKQVSFNTPLFVTQKERPLNSAYDLYYNNQLNKVKNFYNEEFQSELGLLYNDYKQRIGSVSADLMVPPLQEFTILNALKLTPRLKNRKILVELTLLHQKKQILIKELAKAGQKVVSISDLTNINQQIDKLEKEKRKIKSKMKLSHKELHLKIAKSEPKKDKQEKKIIAERRSLLDIQPLLKQDLPESISYNLEKELNLQELIKNLKATDNISEVIPKIFEEEEKRDQEALGVILKSLKEKEEVKQLEEAKELEYQLTIIKNRQKLRNDLKRDLAKGRAINQRRNLRNEIFVKELKDKTYRDKLQTTLKESFNRDEKLLEDLQQQLLAKANSVLLSDKKSALIQSLLLQGKLQPLTLEKLIGLYLQSDWQQFQELTRLEPEQIRQLQNSIHHYLLKRNEHNHRKRILKVLHESDKLDQKESSEEFNISLIQLGDELTKTPAYDPKEHPEILVFEYFEDIMLRPDQVSMIEDLLKIEGEGFRSEVVQLIMGGGKSKVLLPILALKSANGDNLSIIEVPSGLFETNFADLKASTLRLFGKEAVPFIFDRDTPCSTKELLDLYEILDKKVRLNRNFLITTPESIQSFELKYLELLNSEQDNTEQILAFEKVLNLIKEKGDVIIDECDTVLDLKNELNYTEGSKKEIPLELLSNIQKVYKLFPHIIVEHPSGKTTLEQVMLGNVNITQEEKLLEIIDNLAKALVEEDSSPLSTINEKLSLKEKQEFINFLLNKRKDEPEFFNKKLHRNKADLELIGLMKAELDILKVTLKRKLNEHFGFPLSADFPGSKHIPIPYVAVNKPNEKAEFRALETINYALIAHKQTLPLPLELIIKFLADFKEHAQIEFNNAYGKIPYSKTKAAVEFAILTKNLSLDGNGLSLTNIELEDTESIKTWQEKFSLNEKTHDYIVLNYILRQIKEDAKVTQSNAINHISQFRSARVMSGTVWNDTTYHSKLKFDKQKSRGTDGQTIDLLLEKEKAKRPVSSVHVVMDEPKQFIMDAIINHPQSKNVHSIIDVGALFKGVPNVKVALELAITLSKRDNNKIKCILFFNENNELSVLPFETIKSKEGLFESLKIGTVKVIGSTDPELINRITRSTKDERFTYYDQQHTIGIDIKQPMAAIGFVTEDFDTMAQKLLQGSLRQRQLALKQSIEIIIPKGVKESRPDKESFEMEDVILSAHKTQAQVLVDLNLQAAFNNMNDRIRTVALNKIKKAAFPDKKRLRKIFDEIFSKENRLDNLFEQFGKQETLEKTENILEQHKQNVLEHFKKLLDLSGMKEIKELELINAELEIIKKEALDKCLSIYKQVPQKISDSHLIKEKAKEKEQAKEQQESKLSEEEKLKEEEKRKERERQKQIQSQASTHKAFEYEAWKEFPLKFEEYIGRISPLSEMISDKDKNLFQFESNLYVSRNFQKTTETSLETLGSKFLKPVEFFYILKDPKTNRLNAMIITQEEATQFKDFINTNREKLLKEGYEVWIKSSHDKFLAGTSLKIDHQDYDTLLEQVQYFNGDIDQLELRKKFEWLLAKPKEKLDFLEKTILSNHPLKKKFLSSFQKTFDEEYKSFTEQSIPKLNHLYQAIATKEAKAVHEILNELIIKYNSLTLDALLNESQNKDKQTILESAIKQENFEILKTLLEYPQIRITKENAVEFFELAVKNNNSDFFEFLMNKKAFPKQYDNNEWNKIKSLIFSTNNESFIRSFLKQIKGNWTDAYYNMVSLQMDNWVKLEAEKAIQILHQYQFLSANPDRIWLQYFEQFSNNRNQVDILNLLNSWYQNPPTPGIKDSFQLGSINKEDTFLIMLRKLKNVDLFLKLFMDERFGVKKEDTESLATILDFHPADEAASSMLPQMIHSLIANLNSQQLKNLVVSDSFIYVIDKMLSNSLDYQFRMEDFNKILPLFWIYPHPEDKKEINKLAEKLLDFYGKPKNLYPFISVFQQILMRSGDQKMHLPILETMITSLIKTNLSFIENENFLSILLNNETLLKFLIQQLKEKGQSEFLMKLKDKHKVVYSALLENALSNNDFGLIEELYFDNYEKEKAFLQAFDKSVFDSAIRAKKWDFLGQLILKNFAIEEKEILENVLIYAIKSKNLELASTILKKGISPDLKDNLGNPLILWCAERFDEEGTKLLLQYNVNLKASTRSGRTALDAIFKTSYYDRFERAASIRIGREILKSLGDTQYEGFESLGEQLREAAKSLNLSSLKAILQILDKNELNLKIINDFFTNALRKDNLELIKYLTEAFEHLAQTPPQISYNTSPIQSALNQNNEEMALLLIKASFPIEPQKEVLHNAIKKGYTKLVKLLISETYHLQSYDKYRGECLITAIENGQETIVKLLIDELKIKPNFYTTDNKTPLIVAIQSHQPKLVKLLLDHGASPDQTMKEIVYASFLPSFTSSWQGSYSTSQVFDLEPKVEQPEGKPFSFLREDEDVEYETIKLPEEDDMTFPEEVDDIIMPIEEPPQIIEKPNIRDTFPNDTDTPLMIAMREQQLVIADILIKADADLDLKNRYDQTALELAQKYDEKDFVDLIEKAIQEKKLKKDSEIGPEPIPEKIPEKETEKEPEKVPIKRKSSLIFSRVNGKVDAKEKKEAHEIPPKPDNNNQEPSL